MFYYNIVLIFRNFLRNKLTSIINIIGLSVSLACALMIYLWLSNEYKTDKFHSNDKQLYKVWCNRTRPNGEIFTQESSPRLAKGLKNDFPEVEYAVAVNYMNNSSDGGIGAIAINDNIIKAKGQFTGHDYFKVFTYPLIFGNEDKVFENKSNVVITEELALKLFNSGENAIGKTIEWKHLMFDGKFEISGVCETPPANSTVQFDLIFNLDILFEIEPKSNSWIGSYADTYIVLKGDTNENLFNSKIKKYLTLKHEKNSNRTLFIQKYSRQYLYNVFKNGKQAGGRISYLRLFAAIAIFILLIACVNFMNLSTAQASKRLKEVVVKKILGSTRKKIILQFLLESISLSFVALIFAFIMVELLLPKFNLITGKVLTANWTLEFLLSVLFVVLILGLIAGSYPAVYLSKFNFKNLQNDKINSIKGEYSTRKIFVVFQFVISLVFIVVFLAVYFQMEYIITKKNGYDGTNVIYFQRKGKINNYHTFLNELEKISGVKKVSSMTNNFLNIQKSVRLNSWKGSSDADNKVLIKNPGLNYNMLELLEIDLKEGRTFSKNYQLEESRIILNEAAVSLMELENAIGETIEIDGKKKEIIGVVKDFHFETLYNDIEPLAISYSPYGKNVYLKIDSKNKEATIYEITELYKKFHDLPFDLFYLRDTYQAKYSSESKLVILIAYASIVSILVSCLGLFGLVIFTAEKRKKEVGIRKVLGAGWLNIVNLIIADFVKPVFLSILVAIPISYSITQKWLSNFAYKETLKWWYFIGSSVFVLIVVIVTVAIELKKILKTNPIEYIRDE